ncbi:Rossmann-like and DUF2520 domain-containing protein [Pedobacter gandavensis]|uniref:Rossmann-like and DUF2520 domain-containing protein n=1 Tax=Pedobacter gandavensis TaxID=2679963 RepID=UPI00292EA446|nr:Rossmann-like and DUF2520 domain-containing protein [Pedobacter gandavensis]
MKVVCIGSGNVATHFSTAFVAAGFELIQVWSKNPDHAALLANQVNAQGGSVKADINLAADLYLIAIKDDAIAEMLEVLKEVRGLVLHTSGATDLNVFPASMENYGVLYPLQTFSRSKALDFSKVPLCLEAKNEAVMLVLKKVALALSPLVYEVSSAQRRILHLAAVFACNFSNHLYAIGQDILENNELEFEILRPLILETAEKVQHAFPRDVQTGPAIRNDEQTLIKHKELLTGMPELQDLYETLSKSIKKKH